MAETVDVPYAEIARAAIIPALLYFFASFWSVHLEAGKRGLEGLPKDQLPSFTAEVTANWYLILPLVALVYLLFAGFTALFAGAVGLALTIVLILGLAIAGSLSMTALRVLFWIALGLACAISIWLSVAAVALVTLALMIPAWLSGCGREESRRHGGPDTAGGAGRLCAAPMAKESGLKIGIQAVRIALPAFIVPYLTVADPVLLLQPVPGLDGFAYWPDVGYVAAKATLAVVLWGIAAFGYANGRVTWAERAWVTVAAGFLIFPTATSDAVGLVLAAGFFAWRVLAARRAGHGGRAAS